MQKPSHVTTVVVSRYRAGERHAPHEHEIGNVSLVLSGTLEEQVGNRSECAGPLSVVVKPAGTRHSDRFGNAGATLAQIRLDVELAGTMEDGKPSAADWRWLHDGRVARAFLRLVRRVRSSDAPAPDECDSDVVDLLATLQAPGAATGVAPRWLAVVRECVDETWDRPPSVRALAREVGVHPVYLAREFRRWYGSSITDRVRRHRVRAAAALLAGTRVSISHVALASGFTDQSHLTRVFAAELGTTPGRFRALAGVAERLHSFNTESSPTS
jgi:AraC family transcriptional regulator